MTMNARPRARKIPFPLSEPEKEFLRAIPTSAMVGGAAAWMFDDGTEPDMPKLWMIALALAIGAVIGWQIADAKHRPTEPVHTADYAMSATTYCV